MSLKQIPNICLDYVRHYAVRLTDIRVAGQAVFVIVVLLVSWSSVRAIEVNYTLQKQLAALQQQNDVQSLENANQKLKNDYYNSSQYLELSARQNFGLGASGETELLVPKSVALSYVTPQKPSSNNQSPSTSQSKYLQNLQAWLNFFLHRAN